MSVDVSYHGVPLAQAANARADGDAAFVEIDTPMPVGTWLEVKTCGVSLRARVFRVNEGTQPGMTLRFADGKTLPPEAFVTPPSEMTQETSIPDLMARDAAEPNAPMAEMTSAPPVAAPPPAAAAGPPPPAPIAAPGPPPPAPPVEADAAKREPTPEMMAEDARKTAEMPVISMDALPEDDSPGAEGEADAPKDEGDAPKDDGNGGGGKDRRKKKRFRKTMIGR